MNPGETLLCFCGAGKIERGCFSESSKERADVCGRQQSKWAIMTTLRSAEEHAPIADSCVCHDGSLGLLSATKIYAVPATVLA